MLGIGAGLLQLSTVGGIYDAPDNSGSVSAAALLLASESNGLALDFTDDELQPTLGFYGSARIKDVSTPANEYDSSPTKAASSLLTYTSASPKLCRGPAGTYRYQAHNLYLNSASPANQSITVVSGATYSVTITGSVSVTASGAATGTWTSGTNTFTAATTTLTLGSTSGSGTVHVRRTPSESTYLATTSAARYDLPYEWNTSGVLQGILTEEARTNLLTYCNDLTNAAWTKDNVTAVKTATGPDGVANSATTLKEASGAFSNFRAYVLLTSYTGAYTISLYAKANGRDRIQIRKPDGGDGAWVRFDLTNITATDSGSGPTATSTITDVGNGWRRCVITVTAAASITTVALVQLVDSSNNRNYTGDGVSGVHVWCAQLEAGSTATSPIETFGSTVTRAADSGLGIATSAYPHSATNNAAMIYYVPKDVATAMVALRWDDNTSNEVVSIGHSASAVPGLTVTDGGAAQTAPLTSGTVSANTAKKLAVSWKANAFLLSNGGATAVSDTSGTLPTVTTLDIGPTLTGYIKQIVVLPVEKTSGQVEALAT